MNKRDNLVKIGYWYSTDEPNLPMPDVGFDPVDPKVIEYIENGDVLDSWRGPSTCRICNHCPNGSKCLTDGTYRWPQGLAHYVRMHNTPLPDAFIEHITGEGND